MLYLPTLRSGANGFRLPLAEATAANLISVASANDALQRVSRLLFGLRRDSAFALWSVSHAWLVENRAIQHVHALAAWLADQDLSRILCPVSESPGAGASGAGAAEEIKIAARAAIDWPSFHQLGCRGVAIAKEVEMQLATANPKSDPHRHPQLLLALLVDAPAYLAMAADPMIPVADQRMPDWIPGELAESIRQFTPVFDRPAGNTTDELQDSAWSQECHLNSAGEDTSPRQLIKPVLLQTRRLNDLRAELRKELEQAKLHAMKELAYGASHEINNPLANISTRAQTLLREEYDPQRRRALANINRQAFRAHEMISDMMLYANPPRLERQTTDLNKIIEEVLDELQPMAVERGVRIARSDRDESVVWGDPVQIAVAIKALCQNAIESMSGNGTLKVGAVRSDDHRSTTVITVSDDGHGFSNEVRKHLFEPFFSGREAGRGLGFGLSKVWRIVTDHEGQIEVDSRPGRGTTFTLRLPNGGAPADTT